MDERKTTPWAVGGDGRMTTYSRAALLDWLRNVAPDLRIGKAILDGKRVCFARFTCQDIEHELEALGDDPDEEIVRAAVAAARETMGLPPLFTPDRTVQLEQDIVRASLAGDEAGCEALTRQLFAGRQPRALQATTTFSKRDIW